MRPTSRPGRVISLFLLATYGAATVLYRSDAHNVFPLLRRQGELPGDDPPSCTPSCELGVCGSGLCGSRNALSRRSSDLDDFIIEDFARLNVSVEADHDEGLAKRLFRYDPSSSEFTYEAPTQAEVDSYLPQVFQGAENKYFGWPLPLTYGSGADEDERAVSQQRTFGDKPFQIMSGGLHGCTVIALVSRRAVWMAHYWESYSHGKPNRDTPATDPAFLQRVIAHLRGQQVQTPAPSTYKPYIRPTGPGIDPSLFNQADDETTLYVFTPVADRQKRDSKVIKYPQRITAIERAVKRHIDKSPRIIRATYQRLDYRKPEEEAIVNQSHRGMVLFQYDPKSDGESQRAWRLFLEDRFHVKLLD